MSGYYHVGLHPRIQNLRRVQTGGEVLSLRLPPIRAFYCPVGFLEGNERAGYALEEAQHQGAVLPRRLHVHETWILDLRPVGAPGGEGLHPGWSEDQCAEVQHDPGASAEAAQLRRRLRGRGVPGPAGSV